MDEQKLRQYYDTILAVWRHLKNDLVTVQSVTDCDDPRWAEIVDRYEKMENNAPPDLKQWTCNMIQSTVYELERIWRDRKDGNKS